MPFAPGLLMGLAARQTAIVLILTGAIVFPWLEAGWIIAVLLMLRLPLRTSWSKMNWRARVVTLAAVVLVLLAEALWFHSLPHLQRPARRETFANLRW